MPTMAALRSLMRLTSRSTSSRLYGQQIQQTHQYGKFKHREDLTINTMPIMMMDKRSELNHHQTLQHLQCRQYYTLSTKLLETAAITYNSHPRVQLSKKCNFKSDSTSHAGKTEAKTAAAPADLDAALFGETAKLGLFAKFKHMYKKYWYVLIPVHVITSVGWFGGFYYLSKSGVDIASLLHYMHVSESIIDKLQHSDMGHYAIAYLCYKIATPVRYAVTLGGTTVSIKLLVQAGHIKPMPTKTEFMAMIEKKKADRVQAKLDSAAEEEAAKKETKPK